MHEINYDKLAEWLLVPREAASEADWRRARERRSAVRKAALARKRARDRQEVRDAFQRGDRWI